MRSSAAPPATGRPLASALRKLAESVGLKLTSSQLLAELERAVERTASARPATP